jgi:hypothetical protein
MFYGATLLIYIGALSVFLFNYLFSLIMGKKRKTFKEILNGKPNGGCASVSGDEILLNVIGAITLIVILIIIIKIEAWLRG